MKRILFHFLLLVLLPASALAGKTYTAADFEILKKAAIESSRSYSASSTLNCKDPNAKKPSLKEEVESYLLFADQELVPTESLPILKKFAPHFLALIQSGAMTAPRLTLTAADNHEILTTLRLKQPIAYAEPTDPRLVNSYDLVMNYDRYAQIQTFSGTTSASVVMLLILNKILIRKSVCGMTAAETSALNSYIGNGYYDLNRYLRKKKTPNDDMLNRFESLLTRAMDKIADRVGYVYRSSTFSGSDYSEATYRYHKTGAIITYEAFTSTAATTQYNPNFVIYSYTAKDISAMNPEEHEVLFHSGTRFQVLYNSCEEQNLALWQNCNVLMSEILAAAAN